MKDYIPCEVCKHLFGYFNNQNDPEAYLNWCLEIIAHIEEHITLTFAKIEKELYK